MTKSREAMIKKQRRKLKRVQSVQNVRALMALTKTKKFILAWGQQPSLAKLQPPGSPAVAPDILVILAGWSKP